MPIWPVRSKSARGATAPGDGAVELAAELLLDQSHEFFDAHGVEHIFQPRLGAVGAIAVLDVEAHHRIRHPACILRLDQHAGVAGEIAVAGDAAEAELEPNAGRKTESLVHPHRLEADVVGVLQHRNGAGAVERDVELPRQAVERTVVEDVEMPFARVGTRVDQLLRIDARGGRAGHVADIVGAGAARAEAQILDRLDHGDGVAGFDFADLDIGARRHMRVAAAITLGEIGNAGELCGLENPVRDAQPAHVGVLIRRNVEQTEEAPTEIVRRLWVFIWPRAPSSALGIEGMFVALELFLIGKFAAGSERAVLRFERRSVGAGRLGWRRRSGRSRRNSAGNASCRLGDLHAGNEPFEIALLLGVEIAGLPRGDLLEVGLGHSAGTRVGAVRGAGAAMRGLWVI